MVSSNDKPKISTTRRIIDYFKCRPQPATSKQIQDYLASKGITVGILKLRPAMNFLLQRKAVAKVGGNKQDGYKFILIKADYFPHPSVKRSKAAALKKERKLYVKKTRYMLICGAWQAQSGL